MNFLEQIKYIEDVMDMAVSQGALRPEKAKAMSDKEKIMWYEDLLKKDDEMEVMVDDAIEARYHSHRAK